jgi:ATP-binding cassette subfamily C protein
VHRPWLLILDEATTALDPESESAVWQAMKELRGNTTIVAISHQQALREVADRAYRIQNGRAEPLDAPASSAG